MGGGRVGGSVPDGAEIVRRLQFIEFDRSDEQRLRSMSTAMMGHADGFIADLYAHLDRFEVTRTLLGDAEQVARLKRSQRAYFSELFTMERDLAYVKRRQRVGNAHQRVRLAPQFFLGTYCRYICDLAPRLVHSRNSQGLLELASLLKAVFFDAGLVLDAYFERLASETLTERRTRSEEMLVGANTPPFPDVADTLSKVPMTLLLNDEELRIRRDFVGLDTGAEARIRAAAEALSSAIPPMLIRFYDRLSSDPELSRTVAAQGTVERLRAAQENHWKQLLHGPYDRAYAASRVVVGRTHERIELEPHWFLGGVCVQLCELLPHVAATGSEQIELLCSLVKAAFFDLTFVLDAYMQARLEQLLRAEGYATALLAHMPSALLVTDPQHQIVAANERALEVLGIDGALLFGSDIESVLPIAGLPESLTRVRETGKPVQNILVELSGATGERSLRMNVVPLEVTSARGRWVALLLDDITEIRRHDAAVRNATGWLRQLVEGLPGLIWQVAPRTGRIEAMAGRVEELTGMTVSDWLQLPGGIGALVPPPDRGSWEGKLQRLREPGDSISIEHALVGPPGRVTRLRSTVWVARDDSERLVWRGLSSDITEEARLRSELARQLEDQRELRRLAATAVETIDLGEVYARGCSALRSLLACDGVLLVERGPSSRVGVRAVSEAGVLDRAVVTPSLFPSLASAQVIDPDHPAYEMAELRARRASRVVAAPIHSAEPNAVIIAYWRREGAGGFEDVGKADTVAGLLSAACQRRAHQREQVQQSRRAALGSLAAGVAHDFNNVLAAQIAALGLLRLRIGNDEQLSQLVEQLREYTQTGRDLVAEVLEFARPKEPAAEVDLARVARDAVQLVDTATESEVAIETAIDAGVDARIEPGQLQRVIVNLVDNAIRASEPGQSVSVELFAEDVEIARKLERGSLTPGPYAVVRVTDRGSGIPLDLQSRVFEPFFTTHAGAGGSGLGLSVVHTSVTALGGGVALRSEPGAGTTVEVWIPRSAEHASPTTQPEGALGFQDAAVLMLVEDNTTAREAQHSFLEAAGYRVLPFEDAESALEVARLGERLDVVITDLGLPGMSGVDFVHELRELRPDLPIIAVSGSNLDVEADARLRKPFRLSVLVATIESVLGRN